MNPIKSQSHETKEGNTLISPSDTVAVYTTLRILLVMKASLGLEAMLEYVGKYLCAVEQGNPHMKAAVTKALGLIDVKKMYGEAA